MVNANKFFYYKLLITTSISLHATPFKDVNQTFQKTKNDNNPNLDSLAHDYDHELITASIYEIIVV